MSGSQFEAFLANEIATYGEDAELRRDLHMPVSGLSFAERLLMGIIRANPVEGTKDKQRLADAMRILFGATAGRARSDEKNDERALAVMATWWEMERAQESKMRVRTPEELGGEAASWADDPNKGDPAGRLARKFKDRRAALVNTTTDPRMISIEVLQRMALGDLEELLPRFGVKFFAEE